MKVRSGFHIPTVPVAERRFIDMEINIDDRNIDAEWCSQIAFKGEPNESQLLCRELEEKKIDFTKDASEDYWIIQFGGCEVKIITDLIKKYYKLKACAFLDEFAFRNRNIYVAYSERDGKSFEKIIFVGTCDGQDDISFSINLLQTKVTKYSSTLSLTGKKVSISYSFPFSFEWEDIGNGQFLFYGNILEKYNGTDENVTIPNGIVKIANKAFENNCIIKTVTIPKSVKIIDSWAFVGCENLESISIEKGVEFIGNYAFAGCVSLTEVVLPDTLKSQYFDGVFKNQATNVFLGCKNLKKVILSKKYQKIPNRFFFNCESLETVVIPDGITDIGDDAFRGCKNLKQLTLPDSLKKMSGYNIFGGCESLNDLFIPSSVLKIKDTFKDCKNLTIHTTKGSYVFEFAQKQGIACVIEK